MSEADSAEPTAPPEEWAEAVRGLTARLSDPQLGGPTDPKLGAEVYAYVMHGDNPSVLGRLDYPHRQPLGGWTKPTGQTATWLRTMYDRFTDTPAGHWVRWAKVLDATGRSWRVHNMVVDDQTWPGTLLSQVGFLYLRSDGRLAEEIPFTIYDVAKVVTADGLRSGRLMSGSWRAREHPAMPGRPHRVLANLRGYPAVAVQFHPTSAPRLVRGDVDARLRALGMLDTLPADSLAAYAAELAEASVATSAQVRDGAAPLVARLGPAASEHLRRIAVEGKPDQRRHALLRLWDLAPDEEQRELVRQTAAADRAASVRAVLDKAVEEVAVETPLPDLPATPPIDWVVPWTDDVVTAVAGLLPARPHHPHVSPDVVARNEHYRAKGLKALEELLVSPSAPTHNVIHRVYRFSETASIRDGVEAGTLPAAAMFKLLVGCELLSDGYSGYSDLRWATTLLHEHRGLTLDDVVAHLDEVPRLDAVRIVTQAWFHDSPDALGRGWTPDAVWPFFARNLDRVLDYWQERRAGHSHGFDSEAIFPAIATFPVPPPRLMELCYDLALGSAKSDQRAAQDFLASHPDAVRRASAALSDGNGTIRAVAADWLGRMGDRSAVPALAAAFGKEKNETVQGALLDALVALGDRLEDHFDLASVDAQAAKTVAKGLPAALGWLDAEALPDVRRASGAGTVPRETMLWLVARATAAKSSVPSAVLRACASQLDAGDAEQFADALLQAWIALDEASVGRTSYGQVMRADTQSGAASRGLLAVVAACGGAGSVTDAVRYIRRWHGQRASLSKALVTMLAHHRHETAVEAVVAIAYRFKAPSIERAAREEVAELAERLGWTTDQLADRTVATAGFDEHGVLPLSYGERGFTARLLPDCGIELVDEDGKVLKTLPAPRQSDDPEAAKEAKKSLSAAKKQLADTVRIQTVRLHGAMCSQRVWTGADWTQDLAGHPVLARLAARLVWLAETDERRDTFRLLDDGTLTNAEDEPVTLAPDAAVRIAHDVTLTDDEVARWQQHLTDYEVPSLFWQLGRGRPELTDEQAGATELDAGRVAVPAGRLGQVTTRLGYRRGRVGDSAAYDWFEKEFASLGLRALLMIEGQGIEDHESDTIVEALVAESTATGKRVPLGDLPPVLLVELQHDLAVVVGT